MRRLAESAVASLHPLRMRLTPAFLPAQLSGISEHEQIALSFDDGPDPLSTPLFLDLLGRHEVRATFFVLGHYAALHRDLLRRIADEGHELAIHGWTHRSVVAIRHRSLERQLHRTMEVIEQATGQRAQWYRPPYGVVTPAARRAADSLDLATVLWSAWGRDWEARATPARVLATLDRTLVAGGTVLLHDTDRTSAPGSWRVTLAATQELLARAAGEARLGPLSEHW